MFTNNKSAGTSNKNENVLTCDTKAVDVKVERCDDEVQQSEIELHTYNVNKEEMAAGYEVLQHVDKSNCSKETHSESQAETSEQSQNHNESIIKLETEAMSTVTEEQIDELYAEHDIKYEMVIGPVVVQAFPCMMEDNETHPASHAESSKPSQNHNSNDRNRPIIKLETEAMSTVREKPTEDLYADHEIKDEMVIGPVVLQAVTYMMEENGEPLPKKQTLDTQDKTREPNNTAKQIRTETNTEEMTPKGCNENTEPSDTELIEIGKNKIPNKTSKPRNNTQKNIRNDKNNKRTKNVFQCNVCAKQYDKKPDLAQHIEFHDKTKHDIYFKCKECTYQSVTQCSVERHLKLHDKSRRFVCDVCGNRYPDNAQLQQHLRNVHSDEKILGCGICDYQTNAIGNLNIHIRIHSGEKPYSCSQCDFKCNRKSGLIIHSRIHTGDKPYSCSQCAYKCNQQINLIKHSRLHTGDKPYSCSQCAYKCNQKSDLIKHSRIHTGDKPYSCSQCAYKCNQKNQLITHSRSHTGDKPYSCSQCAYKCNQKIHLITHSRLHTGDKPYSCSQCAYKCNQKIQLIRHLRLHTGDKPYSCSQCAYKCNQKIHLITHSRIHTGEKPYSCSECNYKCTQSSNLKQHLRTHSK